MNRLRAPAWSLLLGLIEGRMGKKIGDESAYSRCADKKVKGRGQRRDFYLPPAREARRQYVRGPFGSVIMTRFNFKVKQTFLLRNWGACVDTKF